jgi:hypothetical protein
MSEPNNGQAVITVQDNRPPLDEFAGVGKNRRSELFDVDPQN